MLISLAVRPGLHSGQPSALAGSGSRQTHPRPEYNPGRTARFHAPYPPIQTRSAVAAS